MQYISKVQFQSISTSQKCKPILNQIRNDTSIFVDKFRNSNFGGIQVERNTRKVEGQHFRKWKDLSKDQSVEKRDRKKEERNLSPDLIRQSSNIILEKIERGGVHFDWDDVEEDMNLEKTKNCPKKEDDDLFGIFDQSFEKSLASTTDFSYQQGKSYWMPPIEAHRFETFEVVPDYIGFDWRTTIMIRNIPNKYSIVELSSQIDEQHRETYDFLYLPCDLKNNCNVGYGFINFTSTKNLFSFYQKFHKSGWKKYRSEKICSLTYARLQGLQQLIDHFENSKIFNQKDKKYRPIIKYEEIQRIVKCQKLRS